MSIVPLLDGGNTGALVTNGALSSLATLTRASGATFFNSAGANTLVSNNIARTDYDPATLALNGLLIEGLRTNLVLNSATLSTQSVTVTAVQHTLSFYGTGSIALSGAFVGTLASAGAFPTRSILTFTPSAGSLTLTVTGSCTMAQLEASPVATSYIPTTGATATRVADIAQLTNLAAIAYNQNEGTFVIEWEFGNAPNGDILGVPNGSSTNDIMFLRSVGGVINWSGKVGAATVATMNSTIPAVANTTFKAAVAYKLNDYALSVAGEAAVVDLTATVPTVTNIMYGSIVSIGTNQLNGWIKNVTYYPVRVSNVQLQALSA